MDRRKPVSNKLALVNGSKIIDVSHLKSKPSEKPSLGFTYIVLKGNCGMYEFLKHASKQNGKTGLFHRFNSFQEKVRKYDSIDQLIEIHRPKSGLKAKTDGLQQILIQYSKQYNIDCSQPLHLHIVGGGSGEFVVHGFILGSCFEVVWIDPFHEVHKS